MFLKIDLKKPSNKNAEVATSAFYFLFLTTLLADRVLEVPSRSRQQKQAFGLRRPSVSELTTLFSDLLLESF